MPAPIIWKGAHGVRLVGQVWGPDAGRPVILLHGGGQSRHAWKNTGAVLADAGFRVIAYDARGHGDSDWTDRGYGIEEMVADLHCVLQQAGTRAPVLVGASMGGATSLVAVGEHKVHASALVLVDIAPRMEPAGLTSLQAFMGSHPLGYENLEEAARSISQLLPGRTRPVLKESIARSLRQGADGRYRWHWDPRFLQTPQQLLDREPRMASSARNVSIPTCLIRGARSELLSREGADAFLQICTGARYAEVPEAGHTITSDNNDAFCVEVLDFLRHELPARSPT